MTTSPITAHHAIKRRYLAEQLVRLHRADEQQRYSAAQRQGRIDLRTKAAILRVSPAFFTTRVSPNDHNTRPLPRSIDAMALQNSQFNADGSVASGRSLPKNAGFGAATGAAAMRSVQLEVRVVF